MPAKIFLMLFLISALITGMTGCTNRKVQHTPAGLHSENQGSKNPGFWTAWFFRNYISAVDGDRCPSIPTCSAYSAEVFQRYGFFKGWLMTVDRLIHEADEGDYSPLVYRDGKIKILDPPESNDIW